MISIEAPGQPADSRWRIRRTPSSRSVGRPSGDDRHLVHAVDLFQPDPDPLAGRGRAGSCRRGRRGSAARGARDRPARPAGPPAVDRDRPGRPGPPGRCARSTARRRPAPRPRRRSPTGRWVRPTARVGCRRRSSRYIVMSRAPVGTGGALHLGHRLGEPVGEVDAAGRDAEQHQVLARRGWPPGSGAPSGHRRGRSGRRPGRRGIPVRGRDRCGGRPVERRLRDTDPPLLAAPTARPAAALP